MACTSCGARRKIISQMLNGNLKPAQGVKAIGSTIKTDIVTIGRTLKLGAKVK